MAVVLPPSSILVCHMYNAFLSMPVRLKMILANEKRVWANELSFKE